MHDRQVHTLLLRLVGPLQSWGTSSRYAERDSGSEPSKSGVVGILAAALGRWRTEPVDDLAALRMGVRVDREGVPGYDFQTSEAASNDRGIAAAKDTPQSVERRLQRRRAGALRDDQIDRASISKRYVLQDAAFLVGLEGDDLDLLTRLDAALLRPVFALSLGRHSYVPSLPVALPGGGLRTRTPLEVALRCAPWPIDALGDGSSDDPLRCVLETYDLEPDALRLDQPIAIAFADRTFGLRPVRFHTLAPDPQGEECQ